MLTRCGGPRGLEDVITLLGLSAALALVEDDLLRALVLHNGWPRPHRKHVGSRGLLQQPIQLIVILRECNLAAESRDDFIIVSSCLPRVGIDLPVQVGPSTEARTRWAHDHHLHARHCTITQECASLLGDQQVDAAS